MSVAISVENLSKSYRLGQIGTGTLSRDLQVWWARMRGKPDPLLKIGQEDHGNRDGETLWALKDVSFRVEQGEVLGIIGRNGAGKSTLLKILSRVTAPTSGQVKVKGRIASLLEVGTGFHPELTGRENIYLNGAILGMNRREIDRKFDEIVDFAEVSEFIDTPVKRYSSGMYVKLAFAVSAYLEADILLIDEVLAVGDAAFQRKCLGKIENVSKNGRTVIFVSHDMTSIGMLCSRSLLIKNGNLIEDGDTKMVIDKYLDIGKNNNHDKKWDLATAPGNDQVRILGISTLNEKRSATCDFYLSDPIYISINFFVASGNIRINPVLIIKDSKGMKLFSTANYENKYWGNYIYSHGIYNAMCEIPPFIFNDGKYVIDLLLIQEMRIVQARVEAPLSFTIHDNGSTRGDYIGDWVGIFRPRCQWNCEKQEEDHE